MSGVNFAGEFEIKEISLTSVQGDVLDLMSQVNLVSINIFEDMFKTGISGSIIFADTNNMITNLPIIGQETLSFKLATPSLTDEDDIIDYTDNPFIIHKIAMRSEVNVKAQMVELQFVSPQVITNFRRRVSKSYTDTIDNIVRDLLENESYIDTGKEITIEPTAGIRRIVSPNTNPYQLIKKLAREAISKDTGSPHYFFYENKNGHHFRTLQDLYSGQVKQQFDGSDRGTDDSHAGLDKLEQSYKRMISFDVVANKDLLANTSSGMLGSKLITHDIYNKNYETFTYSYFDNFEDHNRISSGGGDNPVYSSVSVNFNNDTIADFPDSRIHLHPTSTTTDYLDAQHYTKENKTQYASNKSHDWLLDRKNRIIEYTNGVSMTLTVHGQTRLTVGDMIDLSVPSAASDDEDSYYSGNYLITQLRHSFSIPEKQHQIYMTVRRDSISDNLPGLTVKQEGQLGGKGYRGGYGF